MNETFQDAALRLQRVLRADPRNFDALFGLAMLYGQNGKFEEAQHLMGEAAKLKPASPKILFARGYALQRLGRSTEAVECLNAVLALKPDFPEALVNRAAALFSLRRYAEASADYGRLLSLAHDYPFARGNRLFAMLHCCDWRLLPEEASELKMAVKAGKRAIAPFDAKMLGLTPQEELVCARIWAANECSPRPPLWRGERYNHDHIRIAYLAANFPAHPASPLLAGVVAASDKGRFETIALSFGPDSVSPMRDRLNGVFERYIEIRNESDEEIAARLRAMEIDIAVDLMGFTAGCRPVVLAQRPAPVQVNYLGYPGTMGVGFMDYLIADATVVPSDATSHYAEKIVTLSDCFMPQDGTRQIGVRPTRSEVGLPERGFVFAAYNNVYKILPWTFDVWMRLLAAVEGSVLWLTRTDEMAASNLRREAEVRGVAPERLIFASYISAPEDHLARLGLADLFLDTLPYNAHATASDALWAGLPVLTCKGEAFAGRVAASLLNALGLPELVTETRDDYEAMALKLARDADALAALKAKLMRNRDSFPLFDTARYARNLDAAFLRMHERQRNGEPPAAFAARAAA
jgi:predicted O-linked N-acetylglucosamine transferase (SPINDLY family)